MAKSDPSVSKTPPKKPTSEESVGDLLVPFSAGEPIFEEGDLGSHMYIIESGEVEIVNRVGGRERSLAKLETGDFFGEMAVLEAMPRSASAVCLSDCRLLPIDTPTFRRMLHDYPEITVRILKRLSGRLRNHANEERRAREVAAGVLAGIERRAEVLRPVIGGTEASREADSPGAPTPTRASGSSLLHRSSGTQFSLNEGSQWVLGRLSRGTDQKPDINLGPIDPDNSTSRRHAILTRKRGSFYLHEERHTSNGTWLAGRQLVPGLTYEVSDGDTIKLGLLELTFRSVSEI